LICFSSLEENAVDRRSDIRAELALHTAEAWTAQIAVKLLDNREQNIAERILSQSILPYATNEPVAHRKNDGIKVGLKFRRQRAACRQHRADADDARLTLLNHLIPGTFLCHRINRLCQTARASTAPSPSAPVGSQFLVLNTRCCDCQPLKMKKEERPCLIVFINERYAERNTRCRRCVSQDKASAAS
jgi:hypothetical protein